MANQEMSDKPKKQIIIGETQYRQLMAALSGLIDLFPDETEKKLVERKQKAHKPVQILDKKAA